MGAGTAMAAGAARAAEARAMIDKICIVKDGIEAVLV